ncbi:MAG: branched-chain amino acid ABC transporter permease [Chloroflexi bacterium]|nr:branched-chain amino acid ABC transporter permease [Chloroflexota bacterium]MDA1239604.1 branched-chain amino acid ABC transporter permease [Chloroflexota bacterium]
MTEFAQLLVVGVVVGSIVGLGAMGLTLAFGILKFANFAHGDMMTLGMFLAYAVYTRLDGTAMGPFSVGLAMVPAMLIAMAGVGLVAASVDQTVYRRLRRRGSASITMAIASLGVAIMVRAVIQLIWGPTPVRYATGINVAWTLPFGLRMRPDQVLIVIAMFALAVGLYLLLFKTRLGKAMRATSDNPALADISGIDTERIRAATWMIAGALIAVAGVMFGVQSQLKFDAGFEFLLPMFAAVILGGVGNPWGALAGGMVVGISQEVSTLWIPTGYKTAVPFVLLTVMLIVRPRGLFGPKG